VPNFFIFCPEPCLRGAQRPFRGQECPPKTNCWLCLCPVKLTHENQVQSLSLDIKLELLEDQMNINKQLRVTTTLALDRRDLSLKNQLWNNFIPQTPYNHFHHLPPLTSCPADQLPRCISHTCSEISSFHYKKNNI